MQQNSNVGNKILFVSVLIVVALLLAGIGLMADSPQAWGIIIAALAKGG